MEFSADLIDDRVWLGSIDASEDSMALDYLHVTHILSVINSDLETDENDRFIRKHIHVDDIETTNLLIEFNSCYHFIDKALAEDPKNNVLIHCLAGVSRSATIACMWLMRRYKLSASDALKRLRLARPIVRPNASFAAQLSLFEQMNHQVDIDHTLYKEFQFECVRAEYLDYDTDAQGLEGKNSLREQYRQAFTLPYGHATCTLTATYVCSHCQAELFTNANQSSHNEGGGSHDWFTKYDIEHPTGSSLQIPCEKSLFIHPLEWIMTQIDTPDNAHSDSIKCPSCSTIVGKYSLNGLKCLCGKWVTPAFHFDRDKIERKAVTKINIETKTVSLT